MEVPVSFVKLYMGFPSVADILAKLTSHGLCDSLFMMFLGSYGNSELHDMKLIYVLQTNQM